MIFIIKMVKIVRRPDTYVVRPKQIMAAAYILYKDRQLPEEQENISSETAIGSLIPLDYLEDGEIIEKKIYLHRHAMFYTCDHLHFSLTTSMSLMI